MKAVQGGAFRMISPTFLGNDMTEIGQETVNGATFTKARPMRLDSAALTNRPRMKNQPPITNQDGPPATPGPSVGWVGCVPHRHWEDLREK